MPDAPHSRRPTQPPTPNETRHPRPPATEAHDGRPSIGFEGSRGHRPWAGVCRGRVPPTNEPTSGARAQHPRQAPTSKIVRSPPVRPSRQRPGRACDRYPPSFKQVGDNPHRVVAPSPRQFYWRRGCTLGKAPCLSGCPERSRQSLKIRGNVVIFAPVRTHNRIRSPRLEASGQSGKVDKGSRQIRSVTSGKGLALRAARTGPDLSVAALCSVAT